MFLDAYDFSSEGDEGIKDEAKTLISASVLGLIFEKINGHKDGAVFTPGYITMYICREAIEKVIIRKFNDYYEWQCGNLIDLHNKINDITQANNIINSLKICDPAVGSGHFLVSALNEIIRIKYELGILSDNNGKRIRDYKVEVANDELIITDDEGLSFSYNPQSPESQRIQETIFREKQTIIENCLFGIDINPNSVKICRLRLWIELLKNAFYTKESEYKKLETLPNIDINIKCGNSLLRRFNLNTDIRQMLAKTGIKISDYKEAVYEYKNAPSKIRKKEVHNMINIIKSTLCTEISNNDKKVKELRNNKNKLIDLESPDLFELTAKEKRSIAKDIAKLKRDIAKTENLFEEIRSNKFYLGAFEWRLEFPEVLNNDGDFNGFDCIIGNPPYIQLQKMRKEAAILKQIGYKTFAKSADIFCLFYELGTQLLKEGGLLAYITSNSWLRAGYGKTLKGFLLDNSNITQLIDFPEIRVFESATVRTNILFAESSAYEGVTQVCSVDKTNFCREKLGDYFTKNSISTNLVNNNSWTALSPIEEQIKEKIKIVGKPLKDWNINIFRGILTGYNNAFIIDGETKEKLIQKSPNSTEIIQPILRGKDVKSYKADFADLWIINTHNGYEEVPEISIDNYPGIKEHLDKYISNLQERQDKGCTPYNLRSCIYMKEFSKPKIVWKRVGSNVRFCYDETGCMTLDSTCFATGDHIKYLTIFLNSKIGKYLLKYSPKTGTGDLLISVQAIDPLLVPIPDNETENKLNSMLDIITSNINELKDIEQIQGEIDSILYNLYDLSDEEIEFIEAQ